MIEIKYDPLVRRFRYPEGTFASEQAVKYSSQRFLKDRQSALVNMASDIAADPGNITLQKQTGSILREIHIVAGSLAANGPQNLYANDYLIMARNLKNQYGLTDNIPKEYGLSYLFKDIATGYTGEGQLVRRLTMYSNSYKTSYYAVEQNKRIIDGKQEAKRILGYGESCKECKDYSTYGWIGINDLIIPTQRCSCLTNCNCSVEYR